MGNCWFRDDPSIYSVSSNAKSESPKVLSASSVKEAEEKHLSIFPSNPKEVEDLRRDSAASLSNPSASSVKEAEEEQLSKLPSNPQEVEDVRRDSAANPSNPSASSVKETEEEQLSKLPSNPREVEESRRDSAANPLVAFTYNELKQITGNFRVDYVLGVGGFGSVYKGFITEDFREGLQPLQVAIKVHDAINSSQGHREWLAEVTFLGQLSHPNLVKLVGYCCEDNHRVLIYELMERGSVEACLFSRVLLPLPWEIRMKIAFGAANGLAFLHEARMPVILRDLKTANILLDQEYNAKLSDFGLAKVGPVGDMSHVSTRIMGTFGYAAPEYMMTGHLTAMSDVYSYGVVLLELLTGRKSIDRSREGKAQTLADWAFPLLPQKKKLLKIVDPKLDGNYPEKAVHKTAMLAYHCLNRNPKARPLMRDIVETLEPLQMQVEIPSSNII